MKGIIKFNSEGKIVFAQDVKIESSSLLFSDCCTLIDVDLRLLDNEFKVDSVFNVEIKIDDRSLSKLLLSKEQMENIRKSILR